MTTTLLIILGVLLLLFFITSSSSASDDENAYTASFGNISDHLSFWNKGFAIGSKAFTIKSSLCNFLLAGPTGSGKSSLVSLVCAKFLTRGNNSVIYNDVNGELWEKNSAYYYKKGYKVLKINFADATQSECFNPLLGCKTIADVQKLCQIIVQNTTGESRADPFWENASITLLSLMGRYLVFYCEPKYRTLQNLLRLIERFATDGKSVDKLFIKTDESLLSLYKSTLVMGDKTLQSVIATARTALNLWNDPEVCKVTSTNTIDFSELRSQRVAIFICNPLQHLRYFKSLSALFFQSLFDFVLSRIPAPSENNIMIIIDEFSTYKFPDIAITISNCRKTKTGILICVQDKASLISKYGEHEAHQIVTNCGIQAYLPNQPLHTCLEISKILGRYSYKDSKGTHTRELLTADEIRRCNDAIVLVHNNAPIRYAATPYYKSFWLSDLAKAKPLEIPIKTVANPPLIQFI